MDSVNFDIKEFEFVTDGDGEGEAFASVSLNPTFRWCKFVLTDDLPNANRQRIPQEEFDNLIRTGINAPIKMAAGEIKQGHDNSIPLGVITHLKRENNYVKGLAALWSLERPEDVELIKQRYDEGKPLNLSWEVLYSDAEVDESGVTALRNTALRATTFVGMPAYAGRTPILEVASVKEGTQEETDSNLEDTKLEELEQLKAQVEELTASLAQKSSELDELKAQFDAINAEKETLAAFKKQIDDAKAEEEKFSAIKVKFQEAGLERTEDYFSGNRDKLLALDEGALEFMIQDLVAFAASQKVAESKSSVILPPLSNNNDKIDPKDLGRRLRNR